MPQIVEVNGQHVEFPDGMAAADIEAAIKQNALSIPKPTGGFWSAVGHHVMNLPHGAAQLVENAVGTAATKLAPDSPITAKINQVVAQDNAAMQKREADYQASTPESVASYTGATAGEILPFLVGAPARGLQAIGDLAGSLLPKGLAAKTASAATQGATVGALSPTTAEDYWNQKLGQVEAGGMIGGAIPPAAALIRGGANLVGGAAKPLIAPQKVVAPLLQKIAPQGLPAPAQLVPGSIPTTAQLLATPEAVAVEKAMGNTGPGKIALATRANANNDARIAAIQAIAKTPADLQAAIDKRSEVTGPLRTKVLTDPTTAQPVDATGVLKTIDDLASSSFGTDPVIAKTLTALRTQIGDAASRTDLGAYSYTPSQLVALKPGAPYVRPDLLDGIRRNLRGVIRDNSSTGAVSSEQQAGLEPLASRITSAIESANPGYRDYLAAYARTSQPINTMEAAGSILDNVASDSRSANSSGAPQVTLTRYASALKRALDGPFGIDPSAQTALEAIQSDLQRESLSSGMRSPGSDTAYNLQAPGWLAGKLYGDSFTGSPAGTRALGATLGGIGGWLTGEAAGAGGGALLGHSAAKKVAEFGQSRVNDVFARAMTDPEFAAQLLREANAPKNPPSLLLPPQLGLLSQ
jgi:hypothetical protein